MSEESVHTLLCVACVCEVVGSLPVQTCVECVCDGTCAHVYACVYACSCVCAHVSMCVCVHVCVCPCVCMCVCPQARLPGPRVCGPAGCTGRSACAGAACTRPSHTPHHPHLRRGRIAAVATACLTHCGQSLCGRGMDLWGGREAVRDGSIARAEHSVWCEARGHGVRYVGTLCPLGGTHGGAGHEFECYTGMSLTLHTLSDV